MTVRWLDFHFWDGQSVRVNARRRNKTNNKQAGCLFSCMNKRPRTFHAAWRFHVIRYHFDALAVNYWRKSWQNDDVLLWLFVKSVRPNKWRLFTQLRALWWYHTTIESSIQPAVVTIIGFNRWISCGMVPQLFIDWLFDLSLFVHIKWFTWKFGIEGLFAYK